MKHLRRLRILLLLLPLAALTGAPVAAQTDDADVALHKALGSAFRRQIAARADVITIETGPQLLPVTFGSGVRPRPADSIVISYKGYTLDGHLFGEGEAIEFRIAQLIEGLRIGVLQMKAGDRTIIIVPSELAYGDTGAGQDIPGGATLLFDVELLRILPAAP